MWRLQPYLLIQAHKESFDIKGYQKNTSQTKKNVHVHVEENKVINSIIGALNDSDEDIVMNDSSIVPLQLSHSLRSLMAQAMNMGP